MCSSDLKIEKGTQVDKSAYFKSCIEKEGGFLIYGKIMGRADDYNVVAKKNINEDIIDFNRHTLAFQPSVDQMSVGFGEELLTYLTEATIKLGREKEFQPVKANLKDLIVGGKDVDASYVRYSLWPKQRDGYGRQFINSWVLVIPKELTIEVVDFVKTNPNKIFDFFNNLFNEPKYTADKNGSIHIINGDLIPLDDKGKRTANRTLRKNPGYKLIKYKVE